MRKSCKSLQNVLNELSVKTYSDPMSASAYSQMRSHLKHTAFIELNREIVIPFATEQKQKRYKGWRVLAGDGSKIRLPEHKTVRSEFGAIVTCNGKDATVTGDYLCSQAYVLYDVLNEIVIDGQLGRSDAYEVDLATKSLEFTDEKDLLIYDRLFASYVFLAEHVQRNRHFVIRCSSASFAAARALFAADKEGVSKIVTLSASTTKKRQAKSAGLPLSIKVRFVSVRLSTGELEVLVTSLLDDELYPATDFKEIYWLRWGVETLYDVIKNRLSLENFSGKTALAVKQDFHATLFLTNLESVLTDEADQLLAERTDENKYEQTVSNMVSFHAIKLQAFELLLSDTDPDIMIEHLTKLFLQKPTAIRRDRDVPRQKTKLTAAKHYHKRLRKHCF